jgi:hypothetical protein
MAPGIMNIIAAIITMQPNAHSREPDPTTPVATRITAIKIIGTQKVSIIRPCPPKPPWSGRPLKACWAPSVWASTCSMATGLVAGRSGSRSASWVGLVMVFSF